MEFKSNGAFIRSVLSSIFTLLIIYCTVQSSSASKSCPIPRQGSYTTCNGLPRSRDPVVDDRPVYFNMSGRRAIDFISRVTTARADCQQNKSLPTLSIRYERNIAFRKQAENAVRIANQLSYLLTRGGCGAEENRTPYNMNNVSYDHYLFSLVRNTFTVDSKIMGAGIIFRKDALKGKEYFAPYSLTRNNSYEVRDRATKIVNEEKLLLQYLQHRTKKRNFACYSSLFTSKINESHVGRDVFLTQPYVEYIDGLWGRPYFECFSSKRWLVPYMAPFFKLNYTAERRNILDFM